MSFKRSGNIEDRHSVADTKESYDLKLKESRKEANVQRISNSTNKAKLKQYGTRIIRKEQVQNLRSPLLIVC